MVRFDRSPTDLPGAASRTDAVGRPQALGIVRRGDGAAARGFRCAPSADNSLGKASQPGLPHREGVHRYGAANVSK